MGRDGEWRGGNNGWRRSCVRESSSQAHTPKGTATLLSCPEPAVPLPGVHPALAWRSREHARGVRDLAMPVVPYRRRYGGQTDVAHSDRNVPFLVATGPAPVAGRPPVPAPSTAARPYLHRPRARARLVPRPPPGARRPGGPLPDRHHDSRRPRSADPDRERGAAAGAGTADPAGDVVRWAVFCCALVPVVLVAFGTSLGGAAGTALGLVSVTAACRVLLRRSERGLQAETVRTRRRN